MRSKLHILVLALLFTAAGGGADASMAAYLKSINEFRAQREAKLRADDGWLTVVGLVWLKEGGNRVGSNSADEVRLPKIAPDQVGTLTVRGGKVSFKPASGAGVTMNGAPAPDTLLKPDTDEHYDKLAVGPVTFFIIQRDNKLGVRIKDQNSLARREFKGLNWYAVDPVWRVRGTFIPWAAAHPVTFETAVGVKEQDESPGYVTFEHDGQEYKLEPVVDGNNLWFIMRDGTSGKTTYGASRFLYAPLPKSGLKQKGVVEIDFNRAENPPCVFTDFATCPLPPPQNRLPLTVTAGERMYGTRH